MVPRTMGVLAPIFLVSAAVLSAGGTFEQPESSALGKTIPVPLDRDNPGLGSGSLYFESGAAYDKAKPTVLVIADGQQYFVRKGTVANFQRDLFGDAFNVVGIVTRGTTPEFIRAALGADGQPDWLKAWHI